MNIHLRIIKRYGWWTVYSDRHTRRWIVPQKFFTWQDAIDFANELVRR